MRTKSEHRQYCRTHINTFIMTTYKGWTNYETWLTNLHFGDDLIYDFMRETKATDIYDASLELKEYITDDMIPNLGNNSFAEDIVNSFLDAVNWYEITERYYEKAKSEEEE